MPRRSARPCPGLNGECATGSHWDSVAGVWHYPFHALGCEYDPETKQTESGAKS